ncbi:MAG TPA: SMP-30/gluconolactonase/LRE family protein [Baekduia sp.]|nr:SMP-30/gluconolactonase/LRE family protein [Baekduia sp.]
MIQTRQLTADLRYGEAPRWHAGRLWISDVHGYALKTIDLDGVARTVTEVPGRPSGMGFMPDGRLLLATALDRRLCWVGTDGALSVAADLADVATGVLNDMVVDGAGRAYVGDTGFNLAAGESPRNGRLLLFTEAGGVRVAAEDVAFPNGCVVMPDGGGLILAETFARRLTRFAVADDGMLHDRHVLAELEAPPDGICLDAEGGVWAALPEASRFVRIGPNGAVDAVIDAPAPWAIACVLGGPDRRTLLMSSADTDLHRLRNGDSSGRVDAVEVDVPGAGWP